MCTQPKNATDLLRVVNFNGLLQLVNKFQQACQFHQITKNLLRSGLLQLVICRYTCLALWKQTLSLALTLYWHYNLLKQLATSLLK